VVGEHQEITVHPLVALDGRERARGGLATAAGGSGGLLPVVAVLRRWLGRKWSSVQSGGHGAGTEILSCG